MKSCLHSRAWTLTGASKVIEVMSAFPQVRTTGLLKASQGIAGLPCPVTLPHILLLSIYLIKVVLLKRGVYRPGRSPPCMCQLAVESHLITLLWT